MLIYNDFFPFMFGLNPGREKNKPNSNSLDCIGKLAVKKHSSIAPNIEKEFQAKAVWACFL